VELANVKTRALPEDLSKKNVKNQISNAKEISKDKGNREITKLRDAEKSLSGFFTASPKADLFRMTKRDFDTSKLVSQND
jgi:hypothetical protein